MSARAFSQKSKDFCEGMQGKRDLIFFRRPVTPQRSTAPKPLPNKRPPV